MLLRITLLSLLTSLSAISLHADDVYPSSFAYTMTGKLGEDNRYGDIDHSHFEAGNVLTLTGGDWVQRRTLTTKGFAIFDLHKDNLGGKLKKAEGKKVLLSFFLEKVEGEPNPLRVEYVGTTDELNTERSLKAQFQRAAIHRANRVLDQNSTSGPQIIDVAPLIGREMNDRYLVIRFEQEGLRRQLHSKNGTDYLPDLYVFHKSPDSVRLTITDEADANAVAAGYGGDIYAMPANPINDMPENPINDMPENPINDMPKNPINDMPTNPINDMPANPINDMPSEPINDMPDSMMSDGQ